MKDRDDLIESRIERIMGDAELLKTEINELDRMFDDSEILDAIQSEHPDTLGMLILRMIAEQVLKTAIHEIDEEALDREEARMERVA